MCPVPSRRPPPKPPSAFDLSRMGSLPPLPDDIPTMEDQCRRLGEVRFLVNDWIPLGMVTMLFAEGGTGKSGFALGLVGSLVTCGTWFSGQPVPEPGRAVWIDTEGAAGLTASRVQAWGLPKDRIVITGRKGERFETFSLESDADMAVLESYVRRTAARLVVIDSLSGGHGRDENSTQVGLIVKRLALLAEGTGCAVVVVHHSRKLSPGQAITANDARGSNSQVAMIRSQIGMDKPDPDGKWVRVLMLKENLGLAPEPFGFRMTTAGPVYGPPPGKPRRDKEVAFAERLLRAVLPPGEWVPSKTLDDAMARADVGETAYGKARKLLGVEKKNDGRGWLTRLPAK